MVKVAITGCTHGVNLPDIPEVDLFLFTGDATPVYTRLYQEHSAYFKKEFTEWLNDITAKKVGIAGNHDMIVEESGGKVFRRLPWAYLQNEAIEVCGLKIWGSPMSVTFMNWAFMRDDAGLAEFWNMIPDDVDILLIHGPVYGYGDLVQEPQGRDPHVGSQTLRNKIEYGEYPNLKLLVNSHVHEAYGEYDWNGIKVINASHVNFDYEAVNPPVLVEIEKKA